MFFLLSFSLFALMSSHCPVVLHSLLLLEFSPCLTIELLAYTRSCTISDPPSPGKFINFVHHTAQIQDMFWQKSLRVTDPRRPSWSNIWGGLDPPATPCGCARATQLHGASSISHYLALHPIAMLRNQWRRNQRSTYINHCSNERTSNQHSANARPPIVLATETEK